jgi:dTDP-4-amino-4,6-dideoxygalactose transaminase
VSSRNPEFLSRIKKLRNYGMEVGFDTGSIGLNGKMSELHAIVGLHNLRQFPSTQKTRLQQANCYLERIAKLSHFTVPRMRPEVEHSYKDMVVLVDGSLAGKRDAVAAFLKKRGIETRTYFHPPLHRQTAFRRYADRELPCTQDISERVVCVPFYSRITSGEIEYVVDALAEAERCLA